MDQYDPTRPPAREQAAIEKYFDEETKLMPMEGYSTRQEALGQRERALILLDQLTKAEDVSIRYLALSFFDRFASREQLQDQDIQLAVICCISIAWKMTEDSFSVNLLLTNRPDLNINQDLIPQMEFCILSALDWRLCSVNALNFVMYFLRMLPDDLCPSSKTVKEIIIQAEHDIAFTQFRPSVIAASAIVTASSVRFPGRLQECVDIILSCNHVNKEELNRCSEMYREHILGRTFEAGEASSSKTVEESNSETLEDLQRSLGKELKPETSETVEDSQRRPEEELVPETSETMKEIQRKTGKETFPESSDPETMESIPRKLGKETIPGGSDSETAKEIKKPIHENSGRDKEFEHWSSELDEGKWSPIKDEIERGLGKKLMQES